MNWLSSRFLLFKLLLASAWCESAIVSANAVSCDPCIDRTKVKIGCVHHGLPEQDVFWQSLDSAIEQGATDMGVDLVYDPITDLSLSEEDEASIEEYMSKQIQDLCSEGSVHGIFVTLPSPGIVTALNVCKEANIPAIVFNAGMDTAKDNGYLFVGQDEAAAGYDAGDSLAQVDGIETFCCIDHAPGVNVMKQRCGGFGSGLAANGITEFSDVFVDPNNCTAFEEAIVESCSPGSGNWSDVGLYLAGEPNHKCGVEFLSKETFMDASAAASDVSNDLYSGMSEGLNILFGIDQQAFLQGYYPNSFLTLAATNDQILQNDILKTGPKLVTKPPSDHQQQCRSNGYAVCPTGDSGDDSDSGSVDEATLESSAILSKQIFVPFSICSIMVTSFAFLAFMVY